MELSAFEIALFTGILGVGATLLGVIISYWLSLKLTKKQARMVAGAKLRAAFAQDLADYFLKTGKPNALDLQGAIFRHAPAVEEYRVFVPPESQGRYQKAWEHYHEPFGTLDLAIYTDNREIYIERIKAILKFTEPN